MNIYTVTIGIQRAEYDNVKRHEMDVAANCEEDAQDAAMMLFNKDDRVDHGDHADVIETTLKF